MAALVPDAEAGAALVPAVEAGLGPATADASLVLAVARLIPAAETALVGKEAARPPRRSMPPSSPPRWPLSSTP